MFGLSDDIQELNDEINALKIENKALIACLKLLLSDVNNSAFNEIAHVVLDSVRNKKD